MSSTEFSYWMAFEQLEPFGSHVEDYRHGTVAAMVYNVNRGPNTPAMKASDLMPGLKATLHGNPDPEPEKPTPKLTPEQEAAFLDAVFGF